MNRLLKILVLVSCLFTLKLTSSKAFFDEISFNVSNSNDKKENVKNTNPLEFIDILKKEYNNSDIVGFINIPYTSINEVVLQATDNDYYLKHNIDKKKDVRGTIFLDYRININDSKKILIYGHNSTDYNLPFKQLENYYDENYVKTNNKIFLVTENEIKTYEIFSVFIETKDFQYMNIEFDDKIWLEHLIYLKEKSWFNIDIDFKVTDNILILQTCSYHQKYKKDKNKYLVIVAKEE